MSWGNKIAAAWGEYAGLSSQPPWYANDPMHDPMFDMERGAKEAGEALGKSVEGIELGVGAYEVGRALGNEEGSPYDVVRATASAAADIPGTGALAIPMGMVQQIINWNLDVWAAVSAELAGLEVTGPNDLKLKNIGVGVPGNRHVQRQGLVPF